MLKNQLAQNIEGYLQKFCFEFGNRHVGSPGNQAATTFFAQKMKEFGFVTESPSFECIEWEPGSVCLHAGRNAFPAHVSPYSLPVNITAPLVAASTWDALENVEAGGKILLLHDELTKEQIIPKNFPFYIPVTYPGLATLLEQKNPAAIIAATGWNPELAGAVYPFPLIEDGDFDIPSVYLTAETGVELKKFVGAEISLKFESRRIPSRGCNVVARKNPNSPKKLVFCAHIDAKKGTPGALDNASGVVTLIALAELLAKAFPRTGVEIVALNGEDYYAASGQKLYLDLNAETMNQVELAVNLDLAGVRGKDTILSFFDCPERHFHRFRELLEKQPRMHEGPLWYQSDHMIFVSRQRPAVAITSENFLTLSAEITHTEKDTPDLIDCQTLAEIALLLRDFVVTV